MYPLLIGGLGATELLIILAVLVLLFGASKLPELARGSGRALRIFKSETKGLMDDDASGDRAGGDEGSSEQRQIEGRQVDDSGDPDPADRPGQRRDDTTT